MTAKDTLTFGKGNMKMKELATYLGIPKAQIRTFNLPAGWTCPKADKCKAMVNRETGKLTKCGEWTCYATKAECIYPSVRNSRWHNFDLIQECRNIQEIALLIQKSIPKTAKIIRIHASGDFYKEEYFMAWVAVAHMMPTVQFFAYTKVLQYANYETPDNLSITYSYGSKDDNERDTYFPETPTCYVSTFEGEYNVPVVCNGKDTAHEDYYAILNAESFTIMLH